MPVTLAIIAITCVVSFLAFNNPQLMQRPILVCGDRALIARPPERALALL